jgi:dTDP-glucose 4,6-dehydratase
MTPVLPPQELDEIIDQTRDLWQALAGERLFITGGTGFFGAWLLESFVWANQRLNLGAQAVVLARDPEAFLQRASARMRDPALLLLRGSAESFAFPQGKFACVLHASTERYGAGRDNVLSFEHDVLGTKRTLDLAVQAGAGGYLFTSSGAVYGKQPTDVSHVPESFAGGPEASDPNSGYAQAKRSAEFLCAAYAARHGLRASIARCFAFVGPHLPLDINFAIGNFMRDAMAGGPITIGGDGTPYRSYMYASDLAVWLWTLLFRGPAGRPYNVGSDHALSIAELAREVVQTVAPSARISQARAPVPGQLAERYVPSIARAKNELGLQLTVDLPTAIARSVAWHRQQHS